MTLYQTRIVQIALMVEKQNKDTKNAANLSSKSHWTHADEMISSPICVSI